MKTQLIKDCPCSHLLAQFKAFLGSRQDKPEYQRKIMSILVTRNLQTWRCRGSNASIDDRLFFWLSG